MEKESFVSGLMDGSYKNIVHVYRHAGQRVSRPENIAEHSYFVALLADLIVADLLHKYQDLNIDRYKVLKYGIYHDFEEIYTGDILSPVKYKNAEVKHHLELVSALLLKEGLQESFPHQPHIQKEIVDALQGYEEAKMVDLENQIVKFADMFHYILYIVDDLRHGNLYYREKLPALLQKMLRTWGEHPYLGDYARDLYDENIGGVV